MTSQTALRLSNALLIVALVLLALDLVAMLGKLPRVHQPRDLWLFAFVLLVWARILRRNARRTPTTPPSATS
jgi:hypothetical protein